LTIIGTSYKSNHTIICPFEIGVFT
jgi:hypothetical protein